MSGPGGPGDDVGRRPGGAGEPDPAGGGAALDWEVVHRMAAWVAGQAAPPAQSAADLERIEALGRVAELHVASATGLSPSAGGHPLRVVGVPPSEWARRALARHRPLLEQLAGALAVPGADDAWAEEQRAAGAGGPHDPGPGSDPEADPATNPLERLSRVPPAVARGFVFGWMFGHLAQRALGQYDLPLPGPTDDEIVVVPANLAGFAAEWGLPPDEVTLWVCLHDVTHHAALDRPHVRHRLETLLGRYVSGFDVDAGAFAGELADLDVTDRGSFQQVLGDPERVLEAVRSNLQREVVPHIEAVCAAVAGYVDHVMDQVGPALLPAYPALTEALRRWRVEASWGDRYVAKLLGLEVRQAVRERGDAFVRGVVERAGDPVLARLWESEGTLPTPAEVDAPGLWLARLELPVDDG